MNMGKLTLPTMLKNGHQVHQLVSKIMISSWYRFSSLTFFKITQLIAMSLLVFVILHPHEWENSVHSMRAEKPTDEGLVADDNAARVNDGVPVLPSPLPVETTDTDARERPNHRVLYDRDSFLTFTKKRIAAGDVHLALSTVFALACITLLMICGVLKGKPLYLLPFFCVQVFDFVLSCLTAIGHSWILPNFNDLLANNVPFRDDFIKMNSQWATLVFLLLYVALIMLKAYCIGMVWACYQYLQLKIQTRACAALGDEVAPPPEYEAATKMASVIPVPSTTSFDTPPPKYSSVVE